MRSGRLNLFSVFAFVAKNSQLPSPDSIKQKEYKGVIESTLEKVPDDKPGLYLWGKFNSMGWWETIYLGKAGKKKTSSLHTRLYDELREECFAFWSYVFGSETVMKQAKKLYKGKYTSQITRSLRKIGSHFIIWISIDDEISEQEIADQEEILINIYRPTHNHRRTVHTEPNDLTGSIKDKIEQEIESILNPTV